MRRARWLVGAALLALLVTGLLLRQGSAAPGATAAAPRSAPEGVLRTEAPDTRTNEVQRANEVVDSAPHDRMVSAARLIESVRFDPEAPCPGDDVLVHTGLRASAGAVKVFVEGRLGSPQLVTAREPGPQRVRVLARTWGDAFERRDVTLMVRDCPARARPRADIQARARSDGRYLLSLVPAPPGDVTWELGDGTTLRGQPVVHRYAARSDRPHSSYLVTARFAAADGPRRARGVISHAEPLAIAARTPYPLLANEGPRFVRWDAQDGVRTRRQVHNALDAPVDFSLAELRGFPCDGAAPQVRSLPARELLDVTRLDPGESRELALHVAARLFERPICQLLVRLAAALPDRLATTTIALDTGVPDQREPLDESTRAAIRAMLRERGQRGPISAEELELYELGVSGT